MVELHAEGADYMSQSSPVVRNALRDNVRELYVWGGIKIRARVYNAIRQG
jgi:hypothetical protein